MGLNWVALAGFPENRDEHVEAFRRRVAVGGRAGARTGWSGGSRRLPALSPSLGRPRIALPDQLSPQLRPGLRAWHLRLLRRPVDQFLLPGLGRLYRPGPPPPSLLLIPASGMARISLIFGAPTRS